ncbi:MAG TPA: tyrosinase family protein [Arachnia sp.]|nr:tyrosinase family protein [Arachnia sp.]HMT86279.1 tyrosinase family protein [Arachnia sp.]
MVLERKDIWLAEEADGPWNELVLAYALAFGRLSGPPDPGKPPTWRIDYQAGVHDLRRLPPPTERFLATCQHDTWYFLPWHRMYLLHYEAVVRAIIAELDDDRISDQTRETWALPYWNYQDRSHRILPQAFRDAVMPDGTPNPLAQADRLPLVQSGESPLSDDEVEFAGWWRETFFTLPEAPSFGGTDVGKRHRPFQFADAGALELTPHGSVHMYVGPDMASFATAGTDPIFWLHHCNLDRLWEVWLGGSGRTNPTSGGWLTETFDFRDVEGATWTRTARQVESTVELGYTYEDTSAPVAPPSPTRSREVEVPQPGADDWRRQLTPNTLGSTDEPIVVRSDPATVEFTLAPDDEVRTRSGRPGPARLILRVDNIAISAADLERVSSRQAVIGTYAIYLKGVGSDDEAYVGNLPLFGLQESLSGDDRHELSYSFDATAAVNLLRNLACWSWEDVRIEIKPIDHGRYAGAGDVVEVCFGNVALSYQ